LGGGQEGGLRSSTENTGGILGFSTAANEAIEGLNENYQKAMQFKARIADHLKQYNEIEILSPDDGSPFILSFTSNLVRGEVMQHALEKHKIFVGTGSACASNKATRRIPDALKLKGEYQYGILRVSFGKHNTGHEIDEFLNKFDLEYGKLKNYGN
jgi:cysteine desulfurase